MVFKKFLVYFSFFGVQALGYSQVVCPTNTFLAPGTATEGTDGCFLTPPATLPWNGSGWIPPSYCAVAGTPARSKKTLTHSVADVCDAADAVALDKAISSASCPNECIISPQSSVSKTTYNPAPNGILTCVTELIFKCVPR